MPPAARVTDLHACPMVTGTVPHVGGPILPPCSINVLIGNLPAARATDLCTCVGPPAMIVKGSAGVMINNLPAARIGDPTAHGGTIVLGFPTVIIGEVGGGGGGGGGGGAGGSTLAEAAVASLAELVTGGAMTAPEAQAAALRAAAAAGAPFCALCAAGGG